MEVNWESFVSQLYKMLKIKYPFDIINLSNEKLLNEKNAPKPGPKYVYNRINLLTLLPFLF